ncbi:MAG: hypothetical protein WDN49_23255 [Acetobacteraceae bacterium]
MVALTADAAFATGSALTLADGSIVYTPGLVTAANAGGGHHQLHRHRHHHRHGHG